MECKKCGANIADAAKFCGYCGSKIEQVVSNEPVQNIEQPLESSTNMIQNNDIDLGNTVVVDDLIHNEQISNNNQIPNSPKKSNKNLVLLLAILLITVGVIVLILFFSKSSNNTVSVLEKAFLNLSEKSQNSGTVTAKINIEEESTGSIAVSATTKYTIENNKYNLQLTVNKNMFMDEASMFLSLDESKASIYLQSSLIDMLGMTSSTVNKWLTYSVDLEDEDIELEELEKLDRIYLNDVLDRNHFVYVDKTDDVNHYKLVINEKLIQNIKTKLSKSDDEDIKELADSINMDEVNLSEPINIDFYINDSNELVKISFDLTKLLEEEEINVTKATFDLEFSDLGNTNVTIPNEALTSSEDLMNYLTTNAIADEYNSDTGFDYSY